MPIRFDETFTRRWRGPADVFGDPNVERQYPPDLEVEPVHLDIDLSVDVAGRTAAGCVTTSVIGRRNGATTLQLNAVDFTDLAVADADGAHLSWRYDGARLSIHWQEPFLVGEERRLQVCYRVTRPSAGLYFSQPDDAYPDAPWYAATDHETERARHWLPCVDLPNVRTTLDLRLRADSRFTILANGVRVSEIDHNDGAKTTHWQLTQRCPSYLICFAIGELVVADDGEFVDATRPDAPRALPVAYFCSPQHSPADLLRTFGRTKAMLAWMTRKLGMAFPFPKYYQFALPGITGAMENISLVSWDEKYVLDESLHTELGWLIDQVNVHEMAHSYFGDAVVCRDFAHAWLKESWATYVEQLWREDEYSADEALYVYYRHASDYFDEADNQYKRPIVTRQFRSSWDMYDGHLYPGGACRLHTLRCELGDEVFWKAVRDYLQRYAGKVVETDDFRLVMEEHSGCSLGRFFDQWFHSPGYPDLKVTFTYNGERKEGVFEIEQQQVDGEKQIPVFVLTTDVSWQDDAGDHLRQVRVDQRRQVVIVSMTSEPTQVRFDPLSKALHKLSFNPGDPLLRRQLSQAPDVIGRILAGRELAKTGKRVNIEAVVEAYRREPFWGVRRELAGALGEAGSEAAVAGLAELVTTENDPMVMPALMRAAGKYRDARLAAALTERLRAGLPDLARQAAYTALGAQRGLADVELLAAASRQPSANGFAQAGALAGLAATRRPAALENLLQSVYYGTTAFYARSQAVSALADLGQGQERGGREQVIDKLSDLLRDPHRGVQAAAASGLATVKAVEASAAMESYARSLAHQERVAVERTLASLRSEDKLDGSALKKQVDDLTDKVRKLEDQVQRLLARVEPSGESAGESTTGG
jgi:aminopeptidase N